MREENENIVKGIGFGTTLGLVLGYFLNFAINTTVPNIHEVQKGYIAPSKIEKIVCKDLNGNGEKETIIKIAGKTYLLKYDKKGKPAIKKYKIKITPEK